MNRPYVICHMTMSIDGKVTGDFLEASECTNAIETYYEINRDFHADAFACGRITMEGSFTQCWQPDLTLYKDIIIERTDWVADKEADFFAVAFDRRGRLGWQTSRIVDEDPGYGDAHIIEVLCENVSDAYLAYLQDIRVSYVFAGKDEMDVSLALEKLKRLFGIQTLLLEGGSVINGAFHQADMVDELSLVVAPLIAGETGKPLFYNGSLEKYRLKNCTTYDGSVLWIQYEKD